MKKIISNDVKNYYEEIPELLKTKKHNPAFKKTQLDVPFRIILIGPSGAGKTNLIVDLIKKTNGTFQEIIIICKNKTQPLYEFLENKNPEIQFYEISNGNEIPKLDDFEKDTQKLVIFDDLISLKDQSTILDYFIRGRHNNCSCCYLTQSYYSNNKDFKRIRLQATNIFILKVSNTKDLTLILNEISLGIDKNKLLQYYRFSTQKKMDFLNIDVLNNEIKHNYLQLLHKF